MGKECHSLPAAAGGIWQLSIEESHGENRTISRDSDDNVHDEKLRA